MARMRTLKPGFFSNDLLCEVAPIGRILFQGLWCIADREGRLEDRPKRIKAEVLPYDSVNIERLLHDLAERGFIDRYEIDGHQFIQVLNFSKHQNPHVKEPASIIPARCEHGADTVLDPVEHDAGTGPAVSARVPDHGVLVMGSRPSHGEQEQGDTLAIAERPQSSNGTDDSGGYVNKKPPRGSQAVIDAFSELGIKVYLNARDHAAIKHSNAPPALVAEVYDQVARCEYGDEWMRKHLTVRDAIEWVNGYVEWKAERDWRAGADPIDAVFGKRGSA